MKIISWLLLIAVAAGIGFMLWRWRRREEERERAAEERMTSFMAQARPATQAMPAAPAIPQTTHAGTLLQEKLLLDAASKAGEAGEAALSIQLYARLLARYPDSSFAGQARTAVGEQKKKLARR
jgi:hypothetical protein